MRDINVVMNDIKESTRRINTIAGSMKACVIEHAALDIVMIELQLSLVHTTEAMKLVQEIKPMIDQNIDNIPMIFYAKTILEDNIRAREKMNKALEHIHYYLGGGQL